MQSNNPAFAGTIFGDWERADRRSDVMTVGGTATKAIGLLAILVACAAVTWRQIDSAGLSMSVVAGAGIGGFVLALVTMFAKRWSAVTAPLYAACEGVFLGAVSNAYNGRYQGLVPQAI